MSKKLFTVGDLIKHLNTIDKSLPVGVRGHYGEFYSMDESDFYTSNVFEKLSWEDRNKNKVKPKEFKILSIYTPDIGEEPD